MIPTSSFHAGGNASMRQNRLIPRVNFLTPRVRMLTQKEPIFAKCDGSEYAKQIMDGPCTLLGHLVSC